MQKRAVEAVQAFKQNERKRGMTIAVMPLFSADGNVPK